MLPLQEAVRLGAGVRYKARPMAQRVRGVHLQKKRASEQELDPQSTREQELDPLLLSTISRL